MLRTVRPVHPHIKYGWAKPAARKVRLEPLQKNFIGLPPYSTDIRFLFYYCNLFPLTKQDAKSSWPPLQKPRAFFSSLSYQILFPGRLNRSLGGCQNCRAFFALHLFYAITLNLIAFFFKSAMDQRTYKECDEGIGILLVNNFLQLPRFHTCSRHRKGSS